MLEKFDGFSNYSGAKTGKISNFFRQELFNKNLSQFVIDEYGEDGLKLIKKSKTTNKKPIRHNLKSFNKDSLYKHAIKLIKKNILENGNTKYNGLKLCLDLKFDSDFGYGINSLKTACSKLIKQFIGVSYEDLVLKALNLRDKAISLIKEHIHEISKPNRSPIYTIVDFFTDLGIYSILPTSRLDLHLDRYIRKFVGFPSWYSLLTFVKEEFYPNQTFDWEIDYNYFLEFYKKNPDKSNKFFMDFFLKFPTICKRTIYNWLAKCKKTC